MHHFCPWWATFFFASVYSVLEQRRRYRDCYLYPMRRRLLGLTLMVSVVNLMIQEDGALL